VRPQEFREIDAAAIEPHPLNPRQHGEGQTSALTAAMEELGFYGACIVRPLPPARRQQKTRRYQLIDGHLRKELLDGATVPCLVVEMSDEEAAKAVASHDQITGLATIDPAILRSLTEGLEWSSAELSGLVDSVLADAEALLDGAGTGDAAGKKDVSFEAAEETAGRKTRYQILIECANEEVQIELLQRLESEGIDCRSLIL
jgi:hypothetical protein